VDLLGERLRYRCGRPAHDDRMTRLGMRSWATSQMMATRELYVSLSSWMMDEATHPTPGGWRWLVSHHASRTCCALAHPCGNHRTASGSRDLRPGQPLCARTPQEQLQRDTTAAL